MGQKVYRQGDLAFIPREDLPKSVAEVETLKGRDAKSGAKILRTRTIRRGENGGIHAIAEETKNAVFYELDGVRYIIGPEGVGIVHGTHDPIQLPPGSYEVRVQREAEGSSWRNVRD